MIYRKCRDALCDGPDDPWKLIAMTGGCFGGLLLWIAIIYGLNGLFA
ncbi:hypothetical protein [Tardibacter chloracetimidivorans]|nr:hypothetical protein [Tardibacter chloracetimidivorans]